VKCKPDNNKAGDGRKTKKMNTLDAIKTLTFGTELEYTGITRDRAAKAIQKVVGGVVRYTGTVYDTWSVIDAQGREWKAMRDASLGYGGGCEVVTPVLKYDDMETLQEVVRALRKAGAKTPECTSQHVHVGVGHLNATQIANIAKIFYKQEELILKSVGTLPNRLAHYTKKTDPEFINKIQAKKQETKEQLNAAWFGYYNPIPAHYDDHRYRDLNLNNVWRTGTIEFRLFNGTTHAGEVKSHIQLALAIVAKGAAAKAASAKNRREYSEASAKYDMRVFLVGLGMNSDEFKTARHHLLKRLPGDIGRKYGRTA
jgi:hypothetical protein